MSEKPSKYHNRCFVGKGTEGADEYGYKYYWNSSHEELEPTEVFYPDKYKSNPYCIYCGETAYPIQGGLQNKGYAKHYDTTGHTCICEGAEAEKEYRKQFEELEEKHYQEKMELRKHFQEQLKHNKEKQIEIKLKHYFKELESEVERNSYVDFNKIENKK